MTERERLKRLHTREAIGRALTTSAARSYLRDAVLGASDGIVTTFAVVVGAHAASFSPRVAVVLGAANLLADGFSMASGNFLASRTERQRRAQLEAEERRHVRLVPEGEREEIRQIFALKGFRGDDLERIVEIVTADERLWVDTMLREEYGLESEPAEPMNAAAVTMAAFILAGAIPLAPYFANAVVPGLLAAPYAWSVPLTAATFFAVGAWKGRVVGHGWLLSGLETLLVGAATSTLAYLAGRLLS